MTSHRILICDDEPLLRDLIASHLCMTGFIVSEARDGEDCLWQLRKSLPDALILDVSMPKLNGIQLLRKLKEEAIHCPVILITATTETSKIEEAMALGVVQILPKPFNLSSVKMAIDRVLKDKSFIPRKRSAI